MITYEEVQTPSLKLISVKCDICGKTYNRSNPEDDMEMQEFHHICFTGGFGSIFGDGAEVKCDICQHCLEKMIKDFVRIE